MMNIKKLPIISILSILLVGLLFGVKTAILLILFHLPSLLNINRHLHRLMVLVYAAFLDITFTTIFFSFFSFTVLFLINRNNILDWIIIPLGVFILAICLDTHIENCLNHQDKITMQNNPTCQFLLKNHYIKHIKFNDEEDIFLSYGVFYHYLYLE